MTSSKDAYYIDLPVSTISDPDLLAAVAAIGTNAPSSDVYKNNPAIQTTVGLVTSLGTTWSASAAMVAADEAKLDTDKLIRDSTRIQLTGKIQLLRSQVRDAAPTAAAANAVGFKTRSGNAPAAALGVPTGGLLVASKVVKGQFSASAAAVPGIRTFAMQISVDPVTPTSWNMVDGTAKKRYFKGYASGTRLWLRFASTRGRAQSDWSVPVSILIP